MRAIVYLILGIALTAAGWFWNTSIEISAVSIVAALVMAVGIAFLAAALASVFDKANPTMHKLGRK